MRAGSRSKSNAMKSKVGAGGVKNSRRIASAAINVALREFGVAVVDVPTRHARQSRPLTPRSHGHDAYSGCPLELRGPAKSLVSASTCLSERQLSVLLPL